MPEPFRMVTTVSQQRASSATGAIPDYWDNYNACNASIGFDSGFERLVDWDCRFSSFAISGLVGVAVLARAWVDFAAGCLVFWRIMRVVD